MKTAQILPYVVSIVALCVSVASLQIHQPIPAAGPKPTAVPIPDVNDILARLDRLELEGTRRGDLLLVNERLTALSQYLNGFQTQRTSAPTANREAFERALAEQLARNLAPSLPGPTSTPFSDAFHRELGRQAATPPPGVLDLMEGRSSR